MTANTSTTEPIKGEKSDFQGGLVKEKEMKEVKGSQGLVRQLSCAFVINLVSLLRGASVSSSSIILHELENSTEHIQDNHCHRGDNCSTINNIILGPFAVFDDFHVTQEEGSWIGNVESNHVDCRH